MPPDVLTWIIHDGVCESDLRADGCVTQRGPEPRILRAMTWRLAPPLTLAVVLLLTLTGCARSTWTSRFGRDHPLAGRIWDVNAGRFVEPEALVEHARGSTFVLLGEQHDNPDHHRLQARVLRDLTASGRYPAVGFEMFTKDQAPAIARYLAAHPHDASGLGDAVNWKQSGWQDWKLYEPVVQATLDAGLPIVATNLTPSTIRALRKSGLPALDRPFAERYGLDRPLPPAVAEEMAAEIRASHCHQVPEPLVARMIAMQRARDATMADALLAGATAGGAVLITGAGHARSDRGVPLYLRAVDPRASITSVAFSEVQNGATDPASYQRAAGAARAPFDYVWFTPRLDNDDPCEKFRKSLERLRNEG